MDSIKKEMKHPALPDGWIIIMDGSTPHYYNTHTGNTQTVFPEPEPPLPAGWRLEYIDKRKWYINDETNKRQAIFPQPPNPVMSPNWESFKVGNTTMYRNKRNPSIISNEFPNASKYEIQLMEEEDERFSKRSQWAGGFKSKRKQSKRKQSNRNQRNRKQSNRKP